MIDSKFHNDFFERRVAMHVGEYANPEEVRDLQNSLEGVFSNVVLVDVRFEPNQPQIALYHKGDYMVGERIANFLAYATALKTAV